MARPLLFEERNCHMAAQTVAGGYKMNNEELGAFVRRVDDIKRQINDGSLSYFLAMRDLQKIVDGKPLMAAQPWKKLVPMGRDNVHGYIEKLREAGLFIAEEVEDLLLQYQYLPMPYLSDFVRVTPADLGLEAPLSYKRFRERASEVVPYDTSYGLTPPTIEVGLMLALDLKPGDIGYREEIVLVTNPFNRQGKDYLLTIFYDTEATCILLREVKNIEHQMFSHHPDDSVLTFALMGTPYHDE
jgi:hypothetical protein